MNACIYLHLFLWIFLIESCPQKKIKLFNGRIEVLGVKKKKKKKKKNY